MAIPISSPYVPLFEYMGYVHSPLLIMRQYIAPKPLNSKSSSAQRKLGFRGWGLGPRVFGVLVQGLGSARAMADVSL